MKRVFTILLVVVCIAINTSAQSPEKISYQAVIRNNSDALVTNTQVGMQISILHGSASGTAVYVETQTPTSNANGLVSLEIGNGTVVSGDFTAIDWANGPYFIKTETDPNGSTGGISYTITGTSQLLSVPYALHAKTAEAVTGGISETDPVYIGSEAANISAADIDNLSNLSGINTGDQDLSGLATTASVTTALSDKVDKVTGKGLSTEDYTAAEKTKLAGLATGAEVNVQADWNQATNTADDYIKNKPTIPAAQVQTSWTATTGMGVLLNKPANIDEDKTDDVTLTGNQTIAGNKTFTGTTTVATPVNATDAATKAYVDELEAKVSLLEDALIDANIHPSKFKDNRDGNIYNYVTIGDQVWMAENLAYLPSVNKVADGSEDAAGSYYYVYGYDGINVADAKSTANYTTYGVLYNWTAAMAGSASSTANPSGVQGVCPTGWHLPSDAEWTELTDYLGTYAGSKLAGNAILWTNGTLDQNANFGETAFTALPGGGRNSNGAFVSVGSIGGWWSAAESNPDLAWGRTVGRSSSEVNRSDILKDSGISVRCVKD